MIHAIALGGFVKKGFPNKTIQTNQESMIKNLPLDPKVSGMDIVVLSERDLSGFKGKDLLASLKSVNKDISVVYVYLHDKELNALKGVDVLQKKVQKMNLASISKIIASVIESKSVSEKDDVEIPSKDSKAEEGALQIKARPEILVSKSEAQLEESLGLPEDVADIAKVERVLPELKVKSLEDRIADLGQFGDFDLFKHALRKDYVVKEIMAENTRYAGAVQMLDVLDRDIANTFASPEKTAEEKMDLIKSTALQRVAYKEETNNILVDKFSNILLAILSSTEATMNKRLDEAKKALDSVAKVQILYKDTETINNLVRQRLEMQVELHEMQANVITLYQQIDSSVKAIIEGFDEGLPSENPYINEHLKMLKPMFVPENAAILAQKLLQDLASGRVKLSYMENQLTELVKLIFSLCEHDNSIIEYQQKLIMLLQSNRVEDVVIVDTILKSCMRLYVGPTEVGTRATAITWAGIMSRRAQNSLLIDLSGKSKFKDYGIESTSLEDFLNERIQKPFLCIEGLVDDGEERIRAIIMELKLRLNYYPYINVILDPSQKTAIRIFAEEALSVHFITDSSPRSVAIMRDSIENFTTENVAKKVVLVAPAVDPLKICNSLHIDNMVTKVIILPYMQRLKAMSFNGLTPYTDTEITEIFEEAFR